jgi:hypothetical protein
MMVTDVGAIADTGMKFTVTRTFLDVFQGNPKQRIKEFVTQEDAELEVLSLEWNVPNLAYALGAGDITTSGSVDTFSFGGDPSTDEVAVKIQHTLPSGNTVSIYIWRAQPKGTWELNLVQDKLQEFPFSFRALTSTKSWDGATLATTQNLFRIVRNKT